jgi:hypothetical protein
MADPTVLDDSARTLSTDRDEGLAIPAWSAIVGFLLLVTGAHVALHYRVHGVFNVHQIVIAFFLVLNLLVNFWELGLYRTADEIRDEYLRTKDRYAGRPTDRIDEVFAMRIPLARLFAFRSWTGIWSAYALFDPGYARKGSFGFNIDVGNGFSTILPATLFGLGMSLEIVSPRVLGLIGVAMFWQMFYGTVVYFFQFFNTGRHVGHAKKDLWVFVGTTNGMWFIFPLWGIAVSVAMVLSGTFDVFR